MLVVPEPDPHALISVSHDTPQKRGEIDSRRRRYRFGGGGDQVTQEGNELIGGIHTPFQRHDQLPLLLLVDGVPRQPVAGESSALVLSHSGASRADRRT